MEFWLLLIAFLCLFVFLLSFLDLSHKNKKLPPGPPTLPVLGNFLWLLRSSNNFSSLEPVLRQLRAQYGPIVTLHLGSEPSIFITTAEAAHKALVRSGSIFASRPPALETTRIMLSNETTVTTAPYGPLWLQLRQNFMSAFHPSRLHLYSDGRKWAMNILRSKLLEEARPNHEAIVVVDHFQHAVFCLLIYLCFGEKYEESVIRQITSVQRAIIKNFVKFNLLNFMPKLGKILFHKLWKELLETRRELENVLLPLIDARREKKHQKLMDEGGGESILSYVDTLIDFQLPDSGRKYSDEELVSLCSEFFHGGTDTSITTLQWAMANIVKHQHIQETLHKEINAAVKPGEEITEEDLKRMPYLKAVILETLRRHPPGHFILPHGVTEDTKLEGYDVPKNSIINFTVADMGWDADVWEDPMEFRPERFLKNGNGQEVVFDMKGIKEIKMMPFGAGRRACPAIAMALLHQEYFVANLVRDFTWTAENGCAIDLSEKQDFTMVMKNPLRVHISPRTC
uniref:Cytochrome P450 n=1 Tax=Populus trichocarpa TaxID=3694 RepID=A0A2K2B4W0_POPTR